MDNCVVCGSTLESYLQAVRDPLTHESFAISKCRRCGLGHTVPQPQDPSHYYTAQYYGNRHNFTSTLCLKRRMKFVATALPQTGIGSRLLDIGCGDGAFLIAAKHAGWKVMGTELNPQPARSAGLEVTENIFELADDNKFDCVTMWHTLEHMRDIPSVLSHVTRLLKPNGILIVAVPDFGGLQARIFREMWFHLDVPRHLYHFDAGALDYCLSNAGFNIMRNWHQEFEYDLMGWSQSMLNCVMPAHPNLFFNIITGKQETAGTPAKSAALVLGSVLTLISLPAQLAGTLLRRGGTLVVTASRDKSSAFKSRTK